MWCSELKAEGLLIAFDLLRDVEVFVFSHPLAAVLTRHYSRPYVETAALSLLGN